MFYLIDGVRFGIIGASDSPVSLGFGICLVATLGICTLAWVMLRSGYRLKA